MASNPDNDRESADAEKVDAAMKALAANDHRLAETKLLAVIAKTPRDYSNTVETADEIAIRFWDQSAFVHYVMWHKDRGSATKNVTWIANAYPRAHFYMGFLCVKRREFEKAIGFLDRGAMLEPTNPLFKMEKAQALVQAGRRAEALALYEQVNQVGEHVSVRQYAMALRGRGFVLIEMGELDRAEAAFRSSLDFDPQNEIALHELQYIEHLKEGGAAAMSGPVQSSGSDLSICGVCGQRFEEGVVVSLRDNPVGICSKCHTKLTKKWWQFWR